MNADTPTDTNLDIERLKRQAKQRFIGAAVLVLIAVVGLPFLLDSQPRSLPSTITIDIPKMDTKTDAKAEVKAEAEAKVESKPETPAATPPLAFAPDAKPNDGARAEALLSGSSTGQYIVQAGSFKEDEKLQAAMAKLTKAGIKHYTQAAKGKDGTPRTRLRLSGSFETREEANAAAAKVAKLGVAAIVLKP